MRAFPVGSPHYRLSHSLSDGSCDMDCSVLFFTTSLTFPSGFVFLPQSFTLALYWFRALTCVASGADVFWCPMYHYSYPSHIEWGQLLPPLSNGYLTALISSPWFHSFSLKNSNQINASTFRCWLNLYLNLQICPGPVPWRQHKLFHFISVNWYYCPDPTKSPF